MFLFVFSLLYHVSVRLLVEGYFLDYCCCCCLFYVIMWFLNTVYNRFWFPIKRLRLVLGVFFKLLLKKWFVYWQTDRQSINLSDRKVSVIHSFRQTDRQTDRHTDRQTNRQTDRQTERTDDRTNNFTKCSLTFDNREFDNSIRSLYSVCYILLTTPFMRKQWVELINNNLVLNYVLPILWYSITQTH